LRGTAQLLVSLLVLMVLAAAVRRQAIVISSTAPSVSRGAGADV